MRTLGLMVLVAACSDPGKGGAVLPDSGIDEGPSFCTQLREELQAQLLHPGGSCDTDADCLIVGGSTPGCTVEPSLVDCHGEPIAASSPVLSQVQQLLQQGHADHCEVDLGELECTPNLPRCDDHVCGFEAQSCGGPPPDAGADAPAQDAS